MGEFLVCIMVSKAEHLIKAEDKVVIFWVIFGFLQALSNLEETIITQNSTADDQYHGPVVNRTLRVMTRRL